MIGLLTVSVVLLIVFAALENLVVDEIVGWLPHLSLLILRCAGRRLPDDARDRYREEWAAELDALADRHLSALAFALSLLVATQAMGSGVSQSVAPADIGVAATEGRGRPNASAGWIEVVATMHDPSLALVDAGIEEASARFALLLAPSEPRALLEVCRLREQNAVARHRPRRAEQPALPEGQEFWAPKSLSRREWVPRRGPSGSIDPEWRIAPLTASEESAGQPA